MFSVFLKPLLGLLTIGGLGTGGYFLYKNIQSKKSEKANEENTVNSGRERAVGSSPEGGRSDGSAIPNPAEQGQGDSPSTNLSGVPNPQTGS